jgi:hypothetical protein
LSIIDYLKYKHDTTQSMVKEGYTYYDNYTTQYRAEVNAKKLDRMGKHVTVTEVNNENGEKEWRIWYKD